MSEGAAFVTALLTVQEDAFHSTLACGGVVEGRTRSELRTAETREGRGAGSERSSVPQLNGLDQIHTALHAKGALVDDELAHERTSGTVRTNDALSVAQLVVHQ